VGCDVETNIIHLSVFTATVVAGSYIAEHAYLKCSAVGAESIVMAVSDANKTMLHCLSVARFLMGKPGALAEKDARNNLVSVGYTRVVCGRTSPTLEMYLLNGPLGGARLSHVVCFVTDVDGEPIESTIYRLGEIRAIEKDVL